MAHLSSRIAFLLTVTIVMAGCNGLASDRSTISDTPGAVTDVAPKEGYLFLENNRSESYRITVSVYNARPRDLTFTFADGTNQTEEIIYEPSPQVRLNDRLIQLAIFGTLTDNITGVHSEREPVWQGELTLTAGKIELLQLPEVRGSYTLFVEMKSAEINEITSLHVLTCDGVSDRPRIQLQKFGESRWGGC